MYNLSKNNYHQKPKNSNIQTPPAVSQFIFELLRDKIDKKGVILDPCSGQGSLLKPWEDNCHPFDYTIYGVDIDEETESDLIANFLTLTKKEFELNYFAELEVKKPALVLCNPPFNGYKGKLGSELWLDKIIELFGKEVPIVLFAPIGFRLHHKGREYFQQKYPPISSIISLPKNIFEGVLFHCEILIFNIEGLKGHYFYSKNQEE